jgi:hypothetical protein
MANHFKIPGIILPLLECCCTWLETLVQNAIHQVARFAHNPKHNHGIVVKRILQYLFGTKHKGLILEPTSSHSLNCYVDADFAGSYANLEQGM